MITGIFTIDIAAHLGPACPVPVKNSGVAGIVGTSIVVPGTYNDPVSGSVHGHIDAKEIPV